MSFQSGPGQVLFQVQDTSGQQNTFGYITYNEILENEGGHMNIDDGIFTAPHQGIYEFNFSTSCVTCQLRVEKNGVESFYFQPSSDADTSTG